MKGFQLTMLFLAGLLVSIACDSKLRNISFLDSAAFHASVMAILALTVAFSICFLKFCNTVRMAKRRRGRAKHGGGYDTSGGF